MQHYSKGAEQSFFPNTSVYHFPAIRVHPRHKLPLENFKCVQVDTQLIYYAETGLVFLQGVYLPEKLKDHNDLDIPIVYIKGCLYDPRSTFCAYCQ